MSFNIRHVEFNDDDHLSNYLDYLFRTGSGQEWANPNTRNNKLFVDGLALGFGDTAEDRGAIAGRVYDFLTRLNADCSVLHSYQYEMYQRGEDNGQTESISKIIRDLDESVEPQGEKVLFAVAHEDEGWETLHLHVMTYG